MSGLSWDEYYGKYRHRYLSWYIDIGYCNIYRFWYWYWWLSITFCLCLICSNWINWPLCYIILYYCITGWSELEHAQPYTSLVFCQDLRDHCSVENWKQTWAVKHLINWHGLSHIQWHRIHLIPNVKDAWSFFKISFTSTLRVLKTLPLKTRVQIALFHHSALNWLNSSHKNTGVKPDPQKKHNGLPAF